MAKCLFIPVTGPVEIREGVFADFQRWVGGYVEYLLFTDTTKAYCNEDGIALGLQRNERATKLRFELKIGLRPTDHIKGNFVIVGEVDADGEWDEVGNGVDSPATERLFKKLLKQLTKGEKKCKSVTT